MADRQRSFADMFPDLIGQMTQGAQWKESMRPRTKKEMARQLTQEDRAWLKKQQDQQWLDRRGNLLSKEPSISSQVLDYLTMIDPRRSITKGFQKFILPKLSKMSKRRQKRQMKEQAEMRPSAEHVMELAQPSVEALEAHEQVSDRMGYNPTDKYAGEHRSPATHSQDLAGRFLQFLRDKDARAIDPSTVPDPDVNLNEFIRDVTRRGQEEARRREAGLPSIRRRDPERFEQVDRAMQKRYGALNDAVISTMADKWRKEVNPDPHRKPSTSDKDILSRTFGRRLFRDLPSRNR